MRPGQSHPHHWLLQAQRRGAHTGNAHRRGPHRGAIPSMSTTRRFRRLLPRFSLGNLLMLMVVVGLSLAWYDQRRKLGEQAETIEQQRLEITRLTVNNILRSDMTDEDKARGIAKFVRLGDRLEEVKKWCVEGWDIDGPDDGLGLIIFSECDLAVRCDSNDLICGFG